MKIGVFSYVLAENLLFARPPTEKDKGSGSPRLFEELGQYHEYTCHFCDNREWPHDVLTSVTLHVTYISNDRGHMIEHIRHKGLRRFYEHDDWRGIPSDMAERIRTVLSAIDQAIP